jgi:hypothetical protein
MKAKAPMADDKSTTAKTAGQIGASKRPQATLDLKATEIKVTPVAGKSQSGAASTGASASAAASASSVDARSEAETPRPAPASSYAMAADVSGNPQSETKMQAQASKPEKAKSAWSTTDTTSAFATSAASHSAETKVVVEKRGAFISHLAAGIVGGVLALSAAEWVLPQLGLEGDTSRLADDTAALSQRLAVVEKSATQNAANPALSAIEGRIANLEKTAQAIPAVTESQHRLVAETKAALASAASDAGSPQLIERLGKVEDKLKALADAGANDPNSGRIEQLAALTGKVSDLETGLATQLAALRTSIAKDVESRTQVAMQVSEAAQSSALRTDNDVTAVKTDMARLAERIETAQVASDNVTADAKLALQEAAQLKTDFESLRAAAAKPADVAAAVAPIAERTATLEKSVQEVMQGDSARKESAERVVLALELQNLKRALDNGQKYAAELDEVKKVAGNRLDLTALTRLQDEGAPSLADLTKEFRVAADNAIDAEAETENASVVDRLWAGAKSVIRVRRIDLKPDDKSAEATIGRMQVALNDGRLTDVLEAAKDLSPKAQDAARPFLDKVAARVSVDTALAGLESQLKSSISAASPQPSKPLP